jgi:hypothetical protein
MRAGGNRIQLGIGLPLFHCAGTVPDACAQRRARFRARDPETPLTLESQMAENEVIFSDGIETDFLEFNSGTKAVIGIAEKKGVLVE